MELLYLNFLEAPNENAIKKAYEKKETESTIVNSDLKELGYDDEEMKNINEAINSMME